MLKESIIALNKQKWIVMSVIIGLVYLLLILIYAENIPFADDLAILSTIYDIHHEPDWHLKLKALFSLHNEHRIAVPRLVAILDYYIRGQHISVISWILAGNISIFIVLYLYFKTNFTVDQIKFFTPVLLIVLQPMHYELMYWGMAALQNIGVIVLSTLSFYQLAYKNNRISAILLAILAVFTSANGILVLIIGIALLLYKRDWFSSLLWLIAGVSSALLYWKGFSVSENSGQGFDQSFPIFKFLLTFINLTGGIAYTQTIPFLSSLLGFFILVAIGFIGYYGFTNYSTRNNRSQQFLICCLLFILSTIAAISLGRNLTNVLLISRYKIYSVMTIALTYSLLINWIKNYQYIFKIALFSGLLFWIISYSRYMIMFDIHSRLLFTHFFNWKYNGRIDIGSAFAEKYYSDNWYKLYQSGQYIPPQSAVEKSKKIMTSITKQPLTQTSFSVTDQLVSIDPILLPIGEYYAVREAQAKVAIYPLNKTNFYRTWVAPSQTEYAGSVNTSYWLSGSNPTVSIVAIH